MLKGPVVRAFGLFGENAGRQFPAAQVIAQAIAAGSLPGTGFIAAVAALLVFLYTIAGSGIFCHW
jgi:hypothetical protein